MYSTDFESLCFIPFILRFGMRFVLAVIRLSSGFSGDSLPHWKCLGEQLGHIVGYG